MGGAMSSTKQKVTIALYDADNVPPGTRNTGAFAEIRKMIHDLIPEKSNKVAKLGGDGGVVKFLMETKGWSYNKSYSYIKNAMEKDKAFTVEGGIIKRT